jgi:hypothetical protein
LELECRRGRDPSCFADTQGRASHPDAAAGFVLHYSFRFEEMLTLNHRIAFALKVAGMCLLTISAAVAQHKTRNVVLIVSDGVRWQEVFTGVDATLLNSEHGGIWASPEHLRQQYWSDNPEARRQKLFPFLWGTVAKNGQIFGNRNRGSDAHVTNGMAFSYPGYNEMLSGHPDPRIDKNEYGPNPNETVFEWLNKDPQLRGRVAVFGTWSTFADIFNEKRSGLVMQCGWDLPTKGKPSPRQELLNELYQTTTKLDDEDVYDSFLQVPLLDFLRTEHPRVLFVGYGETDNWAHSGRYDLVLGSAHHVDAFIGQLWSTMQSMPEYHDQTTFIITTDHGRGSGPEQWKEHGVDEKGSENIWIAVMGPDTPALGEQRDGKPVTQAQIAATVAAFLGRDYRKELPTAAPPMEQVLHTPNWVPTK